jgi:hypothetical protein
MKRVLGLGLATVLAAVLVGVYLSRAGHAPVGQPAVTVMDNQALSGLQAEFNRTASGIRVILLLSPT